MVQFKFSNISNVPQASIRHLRAISMNQDIISVFTFPGHKKLLEFPNTPSHFNLIEGQQTFFSFLLQTWDLSTSTPSLESSDLSRLSTESIFSWKPGQEARETQAAVDPSSSPPEFSNFSKTGEITREICSWHSIIWPSKQSCRI